MFTLPHIQVKVVEARLMELLVRDRRKQLPVSSSTGGPISLDVRPTKAAAAAASVPQHKQLLAAAMEELRRNEAGKEEGGEATGSSARGGAGTAAFSLLPPVEQGLPERSGLSSSVIEVLALSLRCVSFFQIRLGEE